MQPQPQRARARFTSEARGRLSEEVKGERERILQAMNAVTFDLPREAGGLLGGVVRGYHNCFRWDRVFRHRGAFWGAPLIRVMLLRQFSAVEVPTPRSLQRHFAGAGLQPAPKGRCPATDDRRAKGAHDVWQMDASERMALQTEERVSWLRLVDEHSGAVLTTVVFPPGQLEPGAAASQPRRLAADVPALGYAGVVSRGQRRTVGLGGRPADRPGVVGAWAARRHDLEPAAHAAAQRRDRAFPGGGPAVGRAVAVPQRRRVAREYRCDGSPAAGRVPRGWGEVAAADIPRPGALGAGLRPGVGRGPLEPHGRASQSTWRVTTCHGGSIEKE
jgi:hypothetical protein